MWMRNGEAQIAPPRFCIWTCAESAAAGVRIVVRLHIRNRQAGLRSVDATLRVLRRVRVAHRRNEGQLEAAHVVEVRALKPEPACALLRDVRLDDGRVAGRRERCQRGRGPKSIQNADGARTTGCLSENQLCLGVAANRDRITCRRVLVPVSYTHLTLPT